MLVDAKNNLSITCAFNYYLPTYFPHHHPQRLDQQSYLLFSHLQHHSFYLIVLLIVLLYCNNVSSYALGVEVLILSDSYFVILTDNRCGQTFENHEYNEVIDATAVWIGRCLWT